MGVDYNGVNVTSTGRLSRSLSIYLLPGCPWDGICLLWAHFGLTFAAFGSQWGTLKLPLAVLWSPLASLWGRFGPLWGPMASLWVALGSPEPSHFKPLEVWTSFSGSMFTVCDACAQDQASQNSPTAASSCPGKWPQELPLRPHLHTRWVAMVGLPLRTYDH